jgi:hypothetical protein
MPPTDPPTREHLKELASQYDGIEFKSDYTGSMPETEEEAIAQLELLASFKEELDGMPDIPPPNRSQPASSISVNNYLIQGTRWQSCNAYIGNLAVSLLTWFRVRHTVKATYEDEVPYNITSVSNHSTTPISSGITINGILVQVNYDELSKWVTGPVMEPLTPGGTVDRAWWTLWSRYHAHFSAGPFTYSVYDRTRRCEIA